MKTTKELKAALKKESLSPVAQMEKAKYGAFEEGGLNSPMLATKKKTRTSETHRLLPY